MELYSEESEELRSMRDKVLALEIAEFGQHALRVMDKPGIFFILKDYFIFQKLEVETHLPDSTILNELRLEFGKEVLRFAELQKANFFSDLESLVQSASDYVDRLFGPSGNSPRKWIMLAIHQSRGESDCLDRNATKRRALKVWAEHRLKDINPSDQEIRAEVAKLKESVSSSAWTKAFDFFGFFDAPGKRGRPQKE